MARILVAGGGVSGLVAALRLKTANDVVLAESAGRVGGKLTTTQFRGRPLDLGPDAFITRAPAAKRLCEELGLGADLLAPASAHAAIWARGALRPFPSGLALGVPTDLVALARSGVVSLPGVLRALLDRVLPGVAVPAPGTAGAGSDPSVEQVVGGRLGREVLGALVDPLIGGINASDVSRLSFAAAAPGLAAAAAGHRSLIAAFEPLAAAPGRQPSGEPLFLGLAGGFAELAAALEAALVSGGVEIRTSAPLERLARRGPASWQATVGGVELDFDAVVLALPADTAARLLGEGEAASILAGVDYAGVATVTYAFDVASVPAALREPDRGDGPGGLRGSGVLVPRAPDRLVTAATFTSTKWPRSANAGEVVIRASAGRDGDERALELDDAALVERLAEDLARITGIVDAPLETVVQRWPRSFPQYTSGHLARIERLEALVRELGTLRLAGGAYRGIGVPACVASGEAAAAELTEALVA